MASAVNEADGTVRFGALHYTEAGTYNYVIREAEGTSGGVQYDSAEHTVTVIVTDNGDGTLSAKAETKSGEDMTGIVFRNIYEARPASVTLGASKS
ncbi:FctA domain-containing protein, partial [[Ruminococcus] torques]|nr:FctA domain-containing protein [[Ruminococcus] torques]